MRWGGELPIFLTPGGLSTYINMVAFVMLHLLSVTEPHNTVKTIHLWNAIMSMLFPWLSGHPVWTSTQWVPYKCPGILAFMDHLVTRSLLELASCSSPLVFPVLLLNFDFCHCDVDPVRFLERFVCGHYSDEPPSVPTDHARVATGRRLLLSHRKDWAQQTIAGATWEGNLKDTL